MFFINIILNAGCRVGGLSEGGELEACYLHSPCSPKNASNKIPFAFFSLV